MIDEKKLLKSLKFNGCDFIYLQCIEFSIEKRISSSSLFENMSIYNHYINMLCTAKEEVLLGSEKRDIFCNLLIPKYLEYLVV